MSRPGTAGAGTAGRPVSYVPGSDTLAQYAAGPPNSSNLSTQNETTLADTASGLGRSESISQSNTVVPTRGNTLKKKASVRRSGSRKSNYAGSVRSLGLGDNEQTEEQNSAFYCPVPVSGSPTDLLADRFQAWRQVLKNLINYFRDIQKSHESRAKSLSGLSSALTGSPMPSNFMGSAGLSDATRILADFHKLSLAESNKSRELENDVIVQLTGLRSDLQQKIKEIKSLSGDFKNSVGKEQEGTRRAIRALQDSLGSVDHEAGSTKTDPFLVKLGVDRQLEKQIEEENYLHRAYLNLEASGRELESIVVGEIQKAYSVLTNIMKRDADHQYETAERLREGPLAMPKDREWDHFVTHNDQMVDPRVPVRQLESIQYQGKNHPAAVEVKSGMLERKSKYLKNYTPGWYILSPTHLHEFKSADRIAFQQPLMSLYLPDQKLGTRSEVGSSSNKFLLKGRQTGGLHRGHSWIFRAETHDTMLAWYEDLKALTEKRGEARNEFVRKSHARTLSAGSMKAPSIKSADSGMEDDEADRIAFSSEQSLRDPSTANEMGAAGIGAVAGAGAATYAMDDQRSEVGWRPPQRPTPGGRFPSDLNIQRGLSAPLSPSSGNSIELADHDRDAVVAAGALPGSNTQHYNTGHDPSSIYQQAYAKPVYGQSGNESAGTAGSAIDNYDTSGMNTAGYNDYTRGDHRRVMPTADGAQPVETASTYGDWLAPLAAGTTGAALGAGATHLYDRRQDGTRQPRADNVEDQMASDHAAIPALGQSSAPMMVDTQTPDNAPSAPRAMVAQSSSIPPQASINTAITNMTAPAESTPKSAIQPQQPISGSLHNQATLPYTQTPSSSSTTSMPTRNQTTTTTGPGVTTSAPSQVLTSAGIDPNPAQATNASLTSEPESTAIIDTEDTTPRNERSNPLSAMDTSAAARPPHPRSTGSISTISDLHIPGEFPATPAIEKPLFQ